LSGQSILSLNPLKLTRLTKLGEYMESPDLKIYCISLPVYLNNLFENIQINKIYIDIC